MTEFAPIALFVYNRPSHTRQTVKALRENDLSKDSDLVVFSDAPKSAAQTEAVCEVREYIRQIDGFKSVTIVRRETNYGLARSIIGGVTKLCEEYGRVIVLEDDLVTSPHFLRFMNNALDRYESEDRVMHISGFSYPVQNPIEGSTFFFRVPLCWGWATWARSWKFFEKDLNVLQCFTNKQKFQFNIENSYSKFWEQLELNRSGSLNSWFIFWYASVFLQNGLCLYPSQSLVENIGHDGSGMNCGVNNLFHVTLSGQPIAIQNIPIAETEAVFNAHKNYFKKINPSSTNRRVGKIMRMFMRCLNALRS